MAYPTLPHTDVVPPAANAPAADVVRILLVEDNDDHAELFTDALERSAVARFDVMRVATSEEALARAAPGAFAILLLDYQLGNVDGVVLLEQLRDAGTDTPVVLLTSHGSENLAARALRAKADDYLAKSEALVDEGVARAVLRVLERRRLAEQLARVREAEAAARARDAFLTAASHDLKNPLTVIRGTAQILQRRATRPGGVGQDQLLSGLTSIERAATQMASQIEELLDVARLRAGRALELELTPTDLVELANEQVAGHQPAADSHRLRVETAEASLVGLFDRTRMGRVLANLINNAIKYSPAGGDVVVRVCRLPAAPAGAETGESGNAGNANGVGAAAGGATVTVTDQGLGIPDADLPYIFEQFRRSERVVGHISGTGIGLAIVRQVVEQHGGAVTVESRPGEGSSFTLHLPLRHPG